MTTQPNETPTLHERFIPIGPALALLGVKRTRFYELVNAGWIICRKLGRRTLVDRQSIDALFAALPHLKPKAPVRLLTPAELGFPPEPPAPPPIALDLASLLVRELEAPLASIKG